MCDVNISVTAGLSTLAIVDKWKSYSLFHIYVCPWITCQLLITSHGTPATLLTASHSTPATLLITSHGTQATLLITSHGTQATLLIT